MPSHPPRRAEADCLDYKEDAATGKDSRARAIFSRSAPDRLVGQALELEEERVPETHMALGHQHAGGVSFWANPPMGTCKATPLEFTGRVRRIKRRRREGDRA